MVVVVAAIGLIVFSLRTHVGRKFWLGQLLDRDLDRYNRSTFWHGDPKAVSPWTRKPAGERAAWRALAVGLLFLLTLGLLAEPTATFAVIVTVILATGGWRARRALAWISSYRRRRDVITPLYHGLAATVGWPDGTKPTEVITAPADYRTSGVTLQLADTFQRLDTTIDHTQQIASRTLGGEWEADWDLTGRPTVNVHHAPPPPDEVTWDDLEHILPAVEPGHLLLGLGSRNKPVTVDLDSDTPHLMLSVPSGGGKSVAVAMLASQILHHGGELVVIDLKRDTHWIKSQPRGDQLIPGVTYCKTADEAHHKLVDLATVMDARNQAREADPNHTPHRILIVAEELNMTADLLNGYWTDQRQRGTSPALKALRSLMYAGRASRIHVLAITQYGTTQAFGTTGGGAARENAARILGGASTENAWEMLAPQITVRPDMTTHRGRMFLIDGNNYRTVQVGYLTAQQARDWATTGATPPAVEDEDELTMLGFGNL
jgi:hypothetical protein